MPLAEPKGLRKHKVAKPSDLSPEREELLKVAERIMRDPMISTATKLVAIIGVLKGEVYYQGAITQEAT